VSGSEQAETGSSTVMQSRPAEANTDTDELGD
jgi:hypothetical protein